MVLFVLTILFNLILTASLQEFNNVDSLILSQQKLNGPVPELPNPSWPMQTVQTVQGNFFGQAFRNINSKPCSNRRNLQNLQEQWIPTFNSKLIKPLTQFDKSHLTPIKENIDNTDHVLPVVATNDAESRENTPIAENNDENNLSSIQNSIENTPENSVQDIAGQSAPLTEDRVGVELYDPNEIFPTIKPSQYNELFRNADSYKLETVEMVKEPLNEIKEETRIVPEGCLNQKPVNSNENKSSESRRSMLSSDSKPPTPMDPTDNKTNDLPNNVDKETNTNNQISIGRSAADMSDNKDITRKANLLRTLSNQKLSNQLAESKTQLSDPTKGALDLTESRMMLMQHTRMCYACSSASNPTCWAPDRKTTVKYCSKGHDACVTKTFGAGSTTTVIRDCGKSCEESHLPGFVPKFKSCSVCHSDLCNNAYSISGRNALFAFFLMAFIKSIS